MSIAVYIAVTAIKVLGVVGPVAVLLWWLSRGSGLKKDAPLGCNISRITEGSLFAAAATVMFIFLITCREAGGLLLYLKELRPAFVTVYLSLVGLLLLILTGSLIAVLLRRTTLAICVSCAAVCVFMFVTDGPFDLLRRLVNLF